LEYKNLRKIKRKTPGICIYLCRERKKKGASLIKQEKGVGLFFGDNMKKKKMHDV